MKAAWWKEAVVYQIYPRSFYDADGDGIGDLPGITRKLDYIHELGIDVLWLSPIYRSPNDDNGYDVSDYRDIMEEFGTMADFDVLLEQVHRRGMKLIMDLVVNHTSDEHPWFQESRRARNNPYRDWYIWRPGRGSSEPNNWESIFRGSAWQYDETTDEYYLHLFSRKQPDLNWENPDVRQAIYEMMRWWLDKGVDGFRLDAINFLSKAPGLPDAPPAGNSRYAPATQLYAYGPRLFEFLQEMKLEVFDHYDILTIGEAAFTDTQKAVELTHEELGYLNMVFQFEHTWLDTEVEEHITWRPKPMDIGELKDVLTRWQSELQGVAWNSQFFGNHDLPRAVSRFGDDDEYRIESAKLIATVLHTLTGTPFMYQGDEIGMTNVAFASIDDYRDIATLNAYSQYCEIEGMKPEEIMPLVHRFSRDNARTPMQWDDGPNAGFTTGEPWMRVNPNYGTVNVARELSDPDSVLHFYRELIRLRRQHAVMVYGDFQLIEAVPEEVFAYRRCLDDEQLTVFCNFSAQDKQAIAASEPGDSLGAMILANYSATERSQDFNIALRPFEARIYLRPHRYGDRVREK